MTQFCMDHDRFARHYRKSRFIFLLWLFFALFYGTQ